jgi:hypothetical protein
VAIFSHGGAMPRGSAAYGPGSGRQDRPELADIGRQRDDAPLRVSDAHMAAALDQLLNTRSALTRVLLGGAARGSRRRGGGEGGS